MARHVISLDDMNKAAAAFFSLSCCVACRSLTNATRRDKPGDHAGGFAAKS